MTKFINKYSGIDKNLHSLAFNSFSTQIALSKFEDKVYKKKIEGIEIVKPVFITALPRAGTTLLLELFASTSEFVSNTYRDMPFFLIPMFWNKYAKIFRQSDLPRERAHGDGMMVSVDSPEAFEEIIWKSFWHSRYRKDRILPWGTASYPEFEHFFRNHIRKTILLKSSNNDIKGRYISKNNLNIARLKYLNQVFPDAIILVIFRNPFQHALSLLRQHNNFLDIHKENQFASKYMEAIGHYDFGDNIKPIDYNNWVTPELLKSTTTLSFWLQYWINSYRYLLENISPNTKFISFDSLCSEPLFNLQKLVELVEIKNPQEIMFMANRISVPKMHAEDKNTIDSNIIKEVEQIYNGLIERSFI